MEVRQITIDTKISLKDFGDQLQFKLALNQEISIAICLEFLLLKENLINSVGLNFKNSFIILKLSKDQYSYCDKTDFGRGLLKGQISINNLDYILHYILKYYRDGIAETEHIDIDFLNDNGKELTLTISFERYHEYSAEEIRKILK
ncbi:MAG: hypothetical protein QM768_07405 [Agriterribacter sp.]